MSAPALTYTLANSTTADATQVMSNFNDCINGMTDGTKDLTIGTLAITTTLTVGTTCTFGGAVTFSTTVSVASTSTFTGLASFVAGQQFTEISTPSTPAAGKEKLYPKSDGNFYRLNPAGVESQLANIQDILYNLGLANATTTNANDSIKISSAGITALASTNKVLTPIEHHTTTGKIVILPISADITMKISGCLWNFDGKGDRTNVIIRVYEINDTGVIKIGLGVKYGLRSIADTSTSTTQASVNAYGMLFVNSALNAGTWPCKEVGWFYADFTDATDVWAVQVATGEINVGIPVPARDSEVILYTGNGHGSTATKIKRFTTAQRNVGNSIYYVDSATNGGSFTILEDGVYSITYHDFNSAAVNRPFGITVNAASLTTTITSCGNTEIVALASTFGVANTTMGAHCTIRLSAGDIIRAQTDGSIDGNNGQVRFNIVRISD